MGSFTSLNKKVEDIKPKSIVIVPRFSSWHIHHQLRLFPQKDLKKQAGNSQTFRMTSAKMTDVGNGETMFNNRKDMSELEQFSIFGTV